MMMMIMMTPTTKPTNSRALQPSAIPYEPLQWQILLLATYSDLEKIYKDKDI